MTISSSESERNPSFACVSMLYALLRCCCLNQDLHSLLWSHSKKDADISHQGATPNPRKIRRAKGWKREKKQQHNRIKSSQQKYILPQYSRMFVLTKTCNAFIFSKIVHMTILCDFWPNPRVIVRHCCEALLIYGLLETETLTWLNVKQVCVSTVYWFMIRTEEKRRADWSVCLQSPNCWKVMWLGFLLVLNLPHIRGS